MSLLFCSTGWSLLLAPWCWNPIRGSNWLSLKRIHRFFKQGSSGDSVYILIAGKLGVHVQHDDGNEVVLDYLEPGAIVGEMAILSGKPRNATVYAVDVAAALFRLSPEIYHKFVANDAEMRAKIEAGHELRWRRIQLSRILNPFMENLDPESLRKLQTDLDQLQDWPPTTNL